MTIVNLGPSKITGHKTFTDLDYKKMSEDKTVRYVGFRKYSESFYAKYKKLVEDKKYEQAE